MTEIISQASLRDKAINRRIANVSETVKDPARKEEMLAELATGQFPIKRFKAGVDVTKMFKAHDPNMNTLPGGAVAEFITTGNYSADWMTRQRYEIDTGRDIVPALYPYIYNVIVDAGLDKNIEILRLGPGGFVFEEVREGGETKFSKITSSSDTVQLRHYSTGLEYTEDLFIYNNMWRVASFERNVGEAHNALANHIHLWPIINNTYASGNLTNGTALTTFYTNDDMALKFARTLEAAVTHAKVGNRRGSYTLLMNSADIFTMQRALSPVPQQGFAQQIPAINASISRIIEYDGWSGTRGKLQTTYGGVPQGTAFLIDNANRDKDFQSFWKHMLRFQTGNPDISRFIMAQNIWDSRLGVFANPSLSVEKITLPLVSSNRNRKGDIYGFTVTLEISIFTSHNLFLLIQTY